MEIGCKLKRYAAFDKPLHCRENNGMMTDYQLCSLLMRLLTPQRGSLFSLSRSVCFVLILMPVLYMIAAFVISLRNARKTALPGSLQCLVPDGA